MTGSGVRDAPVQPSAPHDEGLSSRVLGKINRNSLFLIAGQLGGRALSFVYILILARYLGVEEFGAFNLVINFVLIAITAVDFGLTRLIVRDLAQDGRRAPEYLATLLPLRAALAILGHILLLVVIWAAGYPERVVLLASIAAVALLPTSLGLVFDAVFHARQQMRYSAGGDVAVAAVQFVTGAAIMLAGGGLGVVLVAGVVGSVGYALYLGLQARACGYPIRARFDRALGTHLLKEAAPFALVTLLAILASRAEMLLLGRLSTPENMGLFSAAAKFTETALLLPVVLASAASPVIAQFHGGSRGHLRDIYLWAMRRVLFVTLPVAMAGVLAADTIMALLFPPEYRRATAVLQLLFCAFPFASLQFVNSGMLATSRRARLMMLNAAVTTAIPFVLGIALIPRYGVLGAAASAVVSQVCMCAFTAWCVRRWFVAFTGAVRYLAPPLASAAIAAIVAAFLAEPWGVWAVAPALATYGLAGALQARRWPARPAADSSE